MKGEDRLSALGDDLLLRILYFAPFKEAASTSVLSRRWRDLWRSSGAANLAVRVPNDGQGPTIDREAEEAFFSHRDAFIGAADAALSAAHTKISRLTLALEGNSHVVYSRFLNQRRVWNVHADVVGTVVSHPAARHVEELRIAIVDDSDEQYSCEEMRYHRGIYSLHSMPSETLRVLDLARCAEIGIPAFTAFPRLASLRLRFCRVETKALQALLRAAPQLATVRLESVHFGERPRLQRLNEHTLRLRCVAATTIVLSMCSFLVKNLICETWAIAIDAPRLRSFTYRGNARPFLLRAQTPDMVHMELHFLKGRNQNQDATRMLFWQFLKNFSNAKVLKMKVNNLEHVAAVGKARRAEHLCSFPNVGRLELEGMYDPTSKKGSVAIGNLLRSCPALRELELKLTTVESDSDRDSGYAQPFLERKDRLDYETSLCRFMRRRSSNKATISMNDQYGEVSDIPGLRGRSFTCLQSSLRSVNLQFRLDGPNCFGVRLTKFFAESAMVLEEISVDTGNQRFLEHMNLNIERWITSNTSSKAACLKRKHLTENSWEFSRNLKVCTDSVRDGKREQEALQF